MATTATTTTAPDYTDTREARIAAMRARRAEVAAAANTVSAANLFHGLSILVPIDLPGERFYPAGSRAIVAAVEPGRGGQVAVTVAMDFGRVRTFLVAPDRPVRRA